MEHIYHAVVSRAVVNVFLLAMIVTSLAQADQLALPAADVIAPVLEQKNIVSKIETDQAHRIVVTATDNIAIKSVILFHRDIGGNVYQTKTMTNIVDTDDYAATLSADQINGEGIEYYIQAIDYAGNTLLLGYAFSPITVTVNTHVTDTEIVSGTEYQPKVEKEKSNKWLWIGLGVLAVGAIAASSGGDSGGSSGSQAPSVIINAPVP